VVKNPPLRHGAIGIRLTMELFMENYIIGTPLQGYTMLYRGVTLV